MRLVIIVFLTMLSVAFVAYAASRNPAPIDATELVTAPVATAPVATAPVATAPVATAPVRHVAIGRVGTASAATALPNPQRAVDKRRLVLERWFAASTVPDAERVLSDHCAQLAAVVNDALPEFDALGEDGISSARQLIRERREETRKRLIEIRPMSVDDAEAAITEYENSCDTGGEQ